MNISVVIPTLNEETLLPLLLDDLRRQRSQPCDIIVADAGSTDRTQAIAREAGAQVVPGGRPPAGRNHGGHAAKGDFLFFLDADVRVPPSFLEDARDEIEERYLDLATCEVAPLSDDAVDKLLHDFMNFAVKVGQFSDPHAPGFCILVSRRLFNRVGGFNESLRMAEDHDFVKRASQFRPLRVLRNTQVTVSVRRFEKEGRVKMVNTVIAVELYRLLFGEVTTTRFDYELGNFTSAEQIQSDRRFKENERLRDRLNQSYSSLITGQGGRPSVSNVPPEGAAGLRQQFEQWRKEMGEWLTFKPKPRTGPLNGDPPDNAR